MHSDITSGSRNGGCPWGGPRFFTSAAWAACAVTLLAACGSTQVPVDGTRPARGETFIEPLAVYRDMGFLTGPPPFPAVGRFTVLPGAADSSLAVLALSIPNSALRFQRSRDGFVAEYHVRITVRGADSTLVREVESRDSVRVPTFAETGRTDESVIFQQALMLLPGAYHVEVVASDANSSRGFSGRQALDVPAYAAAHGVAQPLVILDGGGRAARDVLPPVITNPRHMVPYGGASPRVYLEAWGNASPLHLLVLTEDGDTVWGADITLPDTAVLSSAVVQIPAAALPIGKLWVHVTSGSAPPPPPTPLMMAISDEWMVANFDDMLRVLQYIAFPEEIDSLRTGTGEQRRVAWARFWERRDPLRVTAQNEYRDAFFQRVRYATIAFREPGTAGWATDRGEVYIVLGAPEAVLERYIGVTDITNLPNAQEWIYSGLPGGRVSLLFHDRTGFNRLELTPGSRSEFRSVADRLKRRL